MNHDDESDVGIIGVECLVSPGCQVRTAGRASQRSRQGRPGSLHGPGHASRHCRLCTPHSSLPPQAQSCLPPSAVWLEITCFGGANICRIWSVNMDLISCLRLTIGLNPDPGTEGRSDEEPQQIVACMTGWQSVTFTKLRTLSSAI